MGLMTKNYPIYFSLPTDALMLRYVAIAWALVCSVVGLSAQSLRGYHEPIVRLIGRTPSINADYGLGVSGHIAWLEASPHMQTNVHLMIMAGGCNFPIQGGAKRFYRDIYGAQVSQTDSLGDWRYLGALPEAVAYAATAQHDGYHYILGGQTDKGDTALAYRIRVDAEGKILIESLPPLPAPRSGATAQWIGERLYVLGGREQGRITNTMLSIGADRVWREEPCYPSAPLLKVLSWTDGKGIGVVGSIVGAEGDEPAELSLTGMYYDPSLGKWVSMPLPGMLGGATLGGGLVFYGLDRVLLAGGVHAERFLPAIRQEQSLRLSLIHI